LKITLEYLRQAPWSDVRHLSADQLIEARDLLTAEATKHHSEMRRLEEKAAGRDLTQTQQRDHDAAQAELSELIPIRDVVNNALDSRALDRSRLAMPGGEPEEYRDGIPLTERQSFLGFAQARELVREGEEKLSLRKALRGVVLGDWDDAEAERRAMSESVLAGGGYLLPTVLSSQIIDLARNETRVMQAGARIFPMANKRVDVAKWLSDPSMAWHTEAATISPSDATIGKITLDAKAMAGLTLVSRELLEDASEVDSELRQAFASVLARKIDQVAMYGTGVDPEPEGVKNTAGILTALMGANGAALTNFDPLIDAVGELRDNNEDPTAVIYSSRTGRGIGKLKDTTNQPLAVPGYLDGVRRLETNQVPNNLTQGTSSLASDIFTADWRQLYVGVRTQLQITVLSERYADTGQIGLLAWYRGDIAVARPKAFHVTSGVL
jgi:HK97 family phage major capsid protein